VRARTRAELKAACRMVAESNDAMFERNFTRDDDIRAAEAIERERADPSAPRYGRNSDFPNGVRAR
jgi:hypothetical protein